MTIQNRERLTDRSKLAVINYWYDMYRPFFTVMVFILLAIGFDFKLPKQKFEALQAQIDDVNKKITASEIDRREIKELLIKNLKLSCIDKIQGKQQLALQLIGIDCTSLLNNTLPDIK